MKNIIVLLMDRLHIGYWGAYGNAEIETPVLDRLAAESFLADRFYVDTPDPVRQCRSWWRGVHALDHNATPTIMAQLNASGYRTVLVTDDPDVAYSPDAGDFSDVQLLPIPENTDPCDEIDATHLCGMLATVAATAESLARSGRPYCLWCHLRGFDAPWDFPLFLREKYRGEDDPVPYADVIPPYFQYGIRNEECNMEDIGGRPENGNPLDPDARNDFRQAIVSAYAGGVTMFDELLEMLIEPLRDGILGNETLFLLAGMRGVLFGEHGIIGVPLAKTGRVEPLASPLVQVPLAVRFPDGFGATVRSDALLQPSDMTRLLYEWLELPPPELLQNTASTGPNMLTLIREERQELRESILIVASSDEIATNNANGSLATPTWYLQELDPTAEMNPRFALYVKPDDRWDVNNVAGRCVEIVEQLVEERSGLHRRMVGSEWSASIHLSLRNFNDRGLNLEIS